MSKKFVIGSPLFADSKPSSPFRFWLEEGQGKEGIEILLRTSDVNGQRCHDLLAVSSDGKIWVGEALSLELGGYDEDGYFHLNDDLDDDREG